MPNDQTPSPAAAWYASAPARMGSIRRAASEIPQGFRALHQATMSTGAISELEKEFVALGIGIAVRCDNCIYSHVERCLKLGATPRQVMDVAAVAVMMGGGPAYTYVPVVVDALQALGATIEASATA